MAKRGFLAEVNRQIKQAEKRNQQAQRTAAKAKATAERDAETARKQADRARAAAQKAAVQDQKAAEKAAKLAYEEMRSLEAESRTAGLTAEYDEIDSILSATLDIDDYVDPNSLRQAAEHPPFPRPDLLQPTAPPIPRPLPPEPTYAPPDAVKGIGSLVGGKGRLAKATAKAQTDFAELHQAWQVQTGAHQRFDQEQAEQFKALEARRISDLSLAQQTYDQECQQRETEISAANKELDELIIDLTTGTETAVNEYIGIVLSNSVYPSFFEVETAFRFDAELAELEITAWVPAPSTMSIEKAFKYVKSKDEITATTLSAKAQKDRYSGAVHAVALRSLHEVFEADRQAIIQTISLTIATGATNPATGKPESIAFITVAAARESFMAIDLSNVVPLATLKHLGAQVSKDPFGLVGIDTSQGVRSL